MTDYETIRKEIKTKQESLKEELRSLGENFFRKQTNNLFNDFPELEGFSWNQYTPYFNDGDPCVFHIWNSDYPDIKLTDMDDYESSDDSARFRVPYNKPEGFVLTREQRISESIKSILTAIDESVFESLFGDHATVIVTRDGIEVEECSHD